MFVAVYTLCPYVSVRVCMVLAYLCVYVYVCTPALVCLYNNYVYVCVGGGGGGEHVPSTFSAAQSMQCSGFTGPHD